MKAVSTKGYHLSLEAIAKHSLVSRAKYADGECTLQMLHVDSREVTAGSGFFALQGMRQDGRRYAAEALQRGASALFLEDEESYQRWLPQLGKLQGIFLTPHPRRALAALSAELFQHPSKKLKLLGVVGTNGKTSVTYFLSHMLTAMKKPCGVVGTLGLHGPSLSDNPSTPAIDAPNTSSLLPPQLTTPEAPHAQSFLADLLREHFPYAAMEVSSIGWEQHRCDGLSFAALAFTNLGRDHLDWHGSMEAYQQAKFAPFLSTDAPAVVNIADAAGQQLCQKLSGRNIISWGHAEASLSVANMQQTSSGHQQGLLCFQGQEVPFCFPLPGQFQLENFIATAGLLLAMGEPLTEIAQAAQHCKSIPGRMQPIALGQPFEVLIDYAHTPDALQILLRDTRPLVKPGGQLRLLFGCGGDRDHEKRPLMGSIARQGADDILLTSDNPRSEDPELILAQIAQGLQNSNAEHIVDRKTAIARILERARPGDVVLIAGKGHETFQEINHQRKPLSDVLIAQQWLQQHAVDSNPPPTMQEAPLPSAEHS